MIITGFTDEVSDDVSLQIKALKELGWNHIDLRTVNGKNVSSLTDKEFDDVLEQLTLNDIRISCFGSTVANWGRDATTSLDQDMAEMENSIRHMQKAGVRYIRIMSYKIDSHIPLGSDHEAVVIANIKKIIQLAEDSGIVCLHENCETWGGQSCHHSLRLLEEVDSPALKLVFDTGNPVSMRYVAGNKPYDVQSAVQFFEKVRSHVEYVHIKDARYVGDVLEYTFPGEGSGDVEKILGLIKEHDMQTPISIEPHVAVVFHDPSVTTTTQERWNTFIKYGKSLVEMADRVGIVFDR